MRPIDIYRANRSPASRFDSFSNPEYKAAYEEVCALWNELEKYDVPKDFANKLEESHSRLNAIEVELMWCFAFNEGIEFQRTIGTPTKDCDLSLREDDF